MTNDEFKQVCEEALARLSTVEKRMQEQEKRLDVLFERYEKAMQNLIRR